MTCAVPGCTSPTGGGKRGRAWTIHCDRHRNHARRHGHPEQPAVTLAHLKPHTEAVSRRVRAEPDHLAWTLANERWRAMVDSAEALLAEHRRGHPVSAAQLRAADEIVQLGQGTEPPGVWRRVAAVVVLWQRDPGAFRSDDAFYVQVARVVRRLRDVFVALSWDHKAGRNRRHYRDPPPAAMRLLGHMLATTLGSIGVRIAQLEDTRARQEVDARRALHDALMTLGKPQEGA